RGRADLAQREGGGAADLGAVALLEIVAPLVEAALEEGLGAGRLGRRGRQGQRRAAAGEQHRPSHRVALRARRERLAHFFGFFNSSSPLVTITRRPPSSSVSS